MLGTAINFLLKSDLDVSDGVDINNPLTEDSKKQDLPSYSVGHIVDPKPKECSSVKIAHPQASEDFSYRNLLEFTAQ